MVERHHLSNSCLAGAGEGDAFDQAGKGLLPG
jgi:hypothetical protein